MGSGGGCPTVNTLIMSSLFKQHLESQRRRKESCVWCAGQQKAVGLAENVCRQEFGFILMGTPCSQSNANLQSQTLPLCEKRKGADVTPRKRRSAGFKCKLKEWVNRYRKGM